MNVVWTILSVLTLSGFLLFLLSYRARVFLWLDPSVSTAHLGVEELRKRGSAFGGLYLMEVFALASSCYLITLSLRVLGMTGVDLWIVSPGTAVLVTLGLGPLFLRWTVAERRAGQAGRGTGVNAAGQLFLQTILGAAGRLHAILTGSPGQMEETKSRAVSVESSHGREVLRLLLRLRERLVSEVMVSRIDMVCAEESSTVFEVADLVRDVAFTRIPVFSGTIDTITGYVTAKDVVIRLHQGGGTDAVSSIARKPVYVAADATIEHALEEMQKARATLAIVTGPPGKTTGLVTGEDILEEVVGDLYGDHEPEEPAYQVIDDRTAIVRANVALGDLKEIFGVVPSGDLRQTLGNYVRRELGADPSRGERVSDDVFSYSVAKTTGKLIWSLKVERKN